MKFERNDWTVLLNEDKDITAEGRQKTQIGLFDTVFRSGRRNDKPCDIFTVMFKDVDVMLAQVIIQEDGSTATYSFVPTIVSTDIDSRIVRVDILCNFRVEGGKVFVSSIESGSEFDLTTFWAE